MDPACVMNAFRNSVSDGRVVELDVPTRADWTQQHPDGLVGTRVSLATPAATARYADMVDNGQGAIVPRSTAQGDDAEGFVMGMAIDGASHHDSLGAVFGKGAVEGTCVNLPAGLMTEAAGQTRHKSSTPTANRGERAVYSTFPELVRAARCPSYRMHVSRHDRGDDLMDRGAVQTREIFQLANEAKLEECIPHPVCVAVGLLVQFQQRAARLAAGECDAGTDTEEKENVKEMVAEVVEWILSGTATNDAPSAEVRRDGSAVWLRVAEAPTNNSSSPGPPSNEVAGAAAGACRLCLGAACQSWRLMEEFPVLRGRLVAQFALGICALFPCPCIWQSLFGASGCCL